LQLPRDYTHALDIRNRVMLELEPDHIAIRPDQPDANGPENE
ncbi:ABC transporter ATP-binding protein, partial [Actinacidiphila glaucinigra]